MTERILVEFEPGEGATRRLLGLVEQRGYVVRGVEMREAPCGSRAAMTIDVVPRDAGRHTDVLARLLSGLHCVFAVNPGGRLPAAAA